MKHNIEISVDTSDARKEVDDFGAHFASKIKSNMAELEQLQKTMQKLVKRPWYRDVPTVQWVCLALLVADIITHVVK
jgi:hypothetical protein